MKKAFSPFQEMDKKKREEEEAFRRMMDARLRQREGGLSTSSPTGPASSSSRNTSDLQPEDNSNIKPTATSSRGLAHSQSPPGSAAEPPIDALKPGMPKQGPWHLLFVQSHSPRFPPPPQSVLR